MDTYSNDKFELLKKIGFVREGGTEEELRAANIIKEDLYNIGVESKLESFKIDQYNVKEVKLEVIEPFSKEYTVTGVGFSGSTSLDGITADFEYVEQGEPINLRNAKGKIVLINGGITLNKLENLIKAGVVGIITFSGTVIDDEYRTDIEKRCLREDHLKIGTIPGVTMRAKDAMEMVSMEAKKVKMTLLQEEFKSDSHNVIAEIKGTEYPEEVITFMAHYDSVPYSPGVYDNGAGTVIILDILKYYLANAPKRTLRFVWFGSEERGLFGSKAYVNMHESELEEVKLGINVDMAGPILGEDKAIITADNSLCNIVEYLSKEIGFPITVKQDIYSSDCIPFADKGVPVINFARFGAPGAAPGHNRYDVINHLSAKSLDNTTSFIIKFSEKLVNSCIFPVPREIPSNIVESVDKYLRKKKK